ncbi:rhomboid family intramembrane serine protease [Nocardiopsis sp. MG754419]|uniref:rhomboid family intramembrane serine protease n=1 Tax=Nocardiopsis sp. MG754419 TaxID=2259865 RepID=UPI001BAD07EA|nr:rhomboid family intramembrane serine protease [Nocardiopsis sp. MG754419]MBR8743142.1 rhomboid family intramembrane serine protease [Nocardiopsis sp. MG754419]
MKQSRITAILTVAGMLAAMWVFEIVDTIPGMRLDQEFGLRAWDTSAPWTVLTAPFMHANFPHLIGNSLPFLILGSLVAFSGQGRFLLTTLIVAVVSGVGVWLFSVPGVPTVGASGLVFGYFGYTVLRGIIERKTVDIVIMICVVIFYGTMIWGVLPQHPGVSWQAHLFGFLGGLLAAYVLPRRDSARQISPGSGAQGGYYAP